MNLLLKGASMLIIRRYLDRRLQSLPARLGLTAHKKFGFAAADMNSQKAHVREKEAAKGLSSFTGVCAYHTSAAGCVMALFADG
ncbi:MAG TPA: hypothetical protein VGK01_08385 [Candidatus Angelobacter sp.]